MRNNKIICVIPARGGSKNVTNKNIRTLGEHPLLAYSIIASGLSPSIERTFVSSESEEILGISQQYCGEIIRRPEEYALDTSLDFEWVSHAILWLQKNEGQTPDYIVNLRPTTPLREVKVIEKAIQALLDTPEATSLRSAHKIEESPFKYFRKGIKYWKPLNDNLKIEMTDLPRQSFETVYKPNGYIDIIKTSTVLEQNSLHGSNILAFETEYTTEVDCEDDFKILESELQWRENPIHIHLNRYY